LEQIIHQTSNPDLQSSGFDTIGSRSIF